MADQPPHVDRWVRIEGDGLAYTGPCRLQAIIFVPDAANDWVDIYDGRDTVSGKKFTRVKSSVVVSWPFEFAHGVVFTAGIYIDGIDDAVETTVVFEYDINEPP